MIILSLIEAFDGINSQFKAWTESIENTAQISGQDTLCIRFSKWMGSSHSLVNRLKAQSPTYCGWDSKEGCPHNTQPFHEIVTQPRLLPNWNKVQMSSLTHICTIQVSFCQKFVILQICLEFCQTLKHTMENNERLFKRYL